MITRDEKTVFVLGGGGPRGALQVGALRALLEADYHPDLIVGTSIGAINATFLGMHGFNALALSALEAAWRDAAAAEFVNELGKPAGFVWQAMRDFVGRRAPRVDGRMRAFLAEHGLTADLQFGQLPGVPVRLVAADLNSGRILVYGADATGNVLEAVLASAALPPWVYPLEQDDRLLFDGGALSNLPIETALHEGATEVIALDVSAPFNVPGRYPAVAQWLSKLFTSVQQRQVELELALAAAHNVPVLHLPLRFDQSNAIWDFSRSAEMMQWGYQRARAEIPAWESVRKPERPDGFWKSDGWPARLKWLSRSFNGIRTGRGRNGQP